MKVIEFTTAEIEEQDRNQRLMEEAAGRLMEIATEAKQGKRRVKLVEINEFELQGLRSVPNFNWVDADGKGEFRGLKIRLVKIVKPVVENPPK